MGQVQRELEEPGDFLEEGEEPGDCLEGEERVGAAACHVIAPAVADSPPAPIPFEERLSSDPSVFAALRETAGPSIAIVRVCPFKENLSGSFVNFSAQPFEQKYQVLPPYSTVAAARAGFTVIPQTGSSSPEGGGERTGSDIPF